MERESGMVTAVKSIAIPAFVFAGVIFVFFALSDAWANALANHALSVKAQADAALVYASVRQMDTVTSAALVTINQGAALPWLLGFVIVLVVLALGLSTYQQYQLRAIILGQVLQEVPDEGV